MGRGWVRGIEDALRRFNTHVVRVPEAKKKMRWRQFLTIQ